MQIIAAVVRERSGPFVIDTLELCEPRADEVLVRIIASGLCHTDLHGRDGYFPTMPYPAVLLGDHPKPATEDHLKTGHS